MNKEPIIIHRDELYKQVWETPIFNLASSYGLSDSGLKKICKKLDVPTPPRGYWARLQFNYKVTQVPLPKLKKGQSDSYTIDQNSAERRELIQKSEFDDAIPDEIKSATRIRINKRLIDPHPFICRIKEALEKAKPDQYGVIKNSNSSYLCIRVSPGSLNRALLILNCLIRFFESLGFLGVDKTIEGQTFYFQLFDEKVAITLNEKVKQVAHIPTKKEIDDQQRYFYMTPPRWDYIPTGSLSLSINEWGAYGIRKNWSDTKSKKIEDRLGDAVIGIAKVAYSKKQERLKREEESRIREIEQKKRAEEIARREIEKKRLIELENQAQLWERSNRLRAYISAVEKIFFPYPDNLKEQIEKWIAWAKLHADRLDPLNRKIADIVKEDQFF